MTLGISWTDTQWNPAFHRALKSPKKCYFVYFIPTWPCPGPFLLLLLAVEEGEEDGPSAGPVQAPHGARACESHPHARRMCVTSTHTTHVCHIHTHDVCVTSTHMTCVCHIHTHDT